MKITLQNIFILHPRYNGNVNVVLKTRNFPGDSLTTNSTSVINSSTQQVFVRSRSRQMALRFESDDDAAVGVRAGVGFRVGGTRLDIRPNGRR